MAGRFAPSPTGPLHQGSLVTALASYLDARAHGLAWWVRMEDVDPPRAQPGAAERILAQLQDHGLVWDIWPAYLGGRTNGVLYQSDRGDAYAQELHGLIARGLAFRCRCSRALLSQLVTEGKAQRLADGEVLYPGLCGPPAPPVGENERHAWRFNLPGTDHTDQFVLKRADGLWAYHFAGVIDDAFQGVTRIVRGDDLASALPRHRRIQQALGLKTPEVCHVPVVVNALGQKLSKQSKAKPLETSLQAIQQQLRLAWSHLESTMARSWVEKVERLAQQFVR